MTKRKPPEWTGQKRAAPKVKVPPEPDKTLSGKRYQFEPGEVQSVLAIDANRLLAMEKHQPPGCCGSESHPPVLKYFEAV
jgi:hypothetical protein